LSKTGEIAMQENSIATKKHSRATGIYAKILYRFYLALMRYEGMFIVKIRRFIVNCMVGGVSKDLNIFANVFIEGFEGLTVGNAVSFNRDCNISASGGLEIGDFVSIGHRCSIITNEHFYRDPATPMQVQGVWPGKITLNDNVLIGANSMILSGVSIASGCFVAGGSLVTRSFMEPNKIIGGVPAKIIGNR
jgi:acetyltransferase-like isoleucine patch superfamily enzyme